MTQPKRLIIVLPKRYCANCKRLLPEGHKYPCCSWKCQQEHAAALAAVEQADREREGYPF